LNRSPKLRHFLKNEASDYTNIQIDWVPGHTPTAYFRDEAGQVTSEVVLEDFNRDEMLSFFTRNNFAVKLPEPVPYDANPISVATYKTHHYEYFGTKRPYEDAREFAASRTHNGKKGYVLTITSKDEGEIVSRLAPAIDVWLGANDMDTEGHWTWTQGPENGLIFWRGQGTQGVAESEHFNAWRLHEPNNADNVNEEDCATMNAELEWNDVPCRDIRALVIEYGDDLLPISKEEL